MLHKRQTHIIRKQILELETAALSQSWQWQKRLSRFANGPLAERLSVLFDQQSKPDETLRIDRLELTVDVQESGNWEAEILEQITRQVQEMLPMPAQLDPGSLFPGDDGISETAHTMTAFFYFLETGLLPWWVNVETTLNFEAKIKTLLTGGMTTQWRVKFQALIQSRMVRQRLVLQFNPELLGKLAIVFLDKNKAEIAEWTMFVKTMLRITGPQNEQPEVVYWNTVFEQPTANLRSIWPKEMAKQLAHQPNALAKIASLKLPLPGLQALQNFIDQPQLSNTELVAWATHQPAEFEALLLPVLQGENLPESVLQRIKSAGFFSNDLVLSPGNFTADAQNPELPDQSIATKPTSEVGSTLLEVTKTDAEDNLSEEYGPASPRLGTEDLNEKIREADDLDIYVRNAGLVILHPFLPALFQTLGLAKDGKIENPERAISLLQYLAIGRIGMMEHELPLNKLLCGVPLDLPIRRQVHLTKHEKMEADKLLHSVIGHWSALGNTSADGLRGTFFCREGKLSKGRNKDWLLQVEQRGVDILLTELPWSLSMVRLPWMHGMLLVEWS